MLHIYKFLLKCLSAVGIVPRSKYVLLRGKLRARLAYQRLRPYLKPSPSGKVYLAVVACMKNEAPYIREWVEYHLLQGVERFYLFDNESEDNTKDILAPYVAEGVVVLNDTPGRGIQKPCYNAALIAYGNFARWLAFIDCDEFLVPMRGGNTGEHCGERVSDILKDFEAYPAVAVNWRIFDSNGHIEKPQGLVIESYTRCAADTAWEPNLYVKCVIDPTRTIECGIHSHLYVNGASAVDENFSPIFRGTSEHTENRLRINHYFSKSRAEYLAKIARRTADNTPQREFFEYYLEHPNPTEDTVILRSLPALRAALERRERNDRIP